MIIDINETYKYTAQALLDEYNIVHVKNSQGEIVPTRELVDVTFRFLPNAVTHLCDNFKETRKLTWKTLAAEFLWYMTGNNSSEVVAKYLPNWKKFANPDGTVNSNYGKYWLENSYQIVKLFVTDKHSRQATISIFDNDKRDNGSKDVPCTLTNTFMIRNHELLLFNQMRSNDFWYGFPIDVFCATLFQKLMVNTLKTFEQFKDLVPGFYTHRAFSLHSYTMQCDSKMLQKIIDTPIQDAKSFQIPDDINIINFWDKVYELPNFNYEMIDYFKEHITFDFQKFSEQLQKLKIQD